MIEATEVTRKIRRNRNREEKEGMERGAIKL